MIEIHDRKIFLHFVKQKRMADLRAKLIAAQMEAGLAKIRFLSMLSHEIRTPIGGIIGLTGIVLEQGGIDESKGKLFTGLKTSCERLIITLTDLLDYAKTSGAVPVVMPRHQIQLEEFVNETCTFLEPLWLKKKIHFEYVFDCVQDTVILSDKNVIGRIIVNLVSNAVKFTPQGGV